MFLIFNSESLAENLDKFNRWNLSTITIEKNIESLGVDFINYWLSLPYKNGFRKPEKWYIDPLNTIKSETIIERNGVQSTENYAIPLKHIEQAWVAFPLPPEWEEIPELFKQKALQVFGSGEIMENIDNNEWYFPEDL